MTNTALFLWFVGVLVFTQFSMSCRQSGERRIKLLKRRWRRGAFAIPGVLISAQVKAGLDELTERMPRKAITAQEPGRVSGLPVVMAAVFITSFPSTAVEEQIRLASDRGRGGRQAEGGCVGTAEG